MILRILTARVPKQNVGPFNDLLRAQLDELREQPGIVYAKLARRLEENEGEEVVLIEEWRTPANLFAWTRGRLTKPRLLPGTEDLIEDLAISHYEALDLSPNDLLARVLGGADPAATRAESDAEEEEEDQPVRDEPQDTVRPGPVSRPGVEGPMAHVGGREQRA